MTSTSYNVITHGNVVNTNGVLSNFSVGNYATLPQIYTFGKYSWEFNIKFTTGSDIDANQGILTPVAPNSKDQRDAINIWIWQRQITVGLADTRTTKIYDNAITTASPNTTYFLKIKYENGTYSLKYSTDAITYIDGTGSPVTSTKTLWDCGQIWGFGTARNVDRPFYGTIDLSGCSLIINNQLVWKGTTTTGTRIVNRHDTAANWTSVNPVLAEGEMGVETDTNKFKFGDGATAWSELAYATSGSGGGGDSYTKAETDDLLNAKQDKLTAISPLKIATKVLSPTEGWAVSSSSMQSTYKEHVVNNGTSMSSSDTTMQLSSDSEYPIKSYVAMPYTVGQVIKYRQNRSRNTLTTLVLGDIIDGKIYPVLINSAIGDYNPYKTTALFDGTQELTKEVMTNGIAYSSSAEPGPNNQHFINGATFGCLQNTGTSLKWHVFTPRSTDKGDYGYVTYTTFNGYTIDDLVGKINYAIILAGNTSLTYTPDQFGVYENTLSSYSNISNYQALSPNLFDLTKNEVQTQISTLPATSTSLGIVQPDGTSITVSETGIISGQDVKTFTGYSDTGTLVLKSINGVLQWVAEA